MSDIAIKAENLGKKYTIGHEAENGRYVALRDVLARNAHSFWSKTKDFFSGRPVIQGETLEDIWALKDVSFGIRRGESVGIIGRNGAGKSTLLKILSRITEPSAGRVSIKGRVASLLEVGTGFHPELTGRENIYLNGAILGMTRAEVKRKFDEIVAFAEIEKFLDTPVKRYSSGMYVRLAFAVAAHLEPEILLVDEVLAVGDAAFQKKCLGKMGDVAKEGRTVLFASHNMAAVQNLCKRSLLLNDGRVVLDGSTDHVVMKYLSWIQSRISAPLSNRQDREGNGALRFKRIYALSATRGVTDTLCTGEPVTFVAEYETDGSRPLHNVSVSIPFFDQMGQHMFMCWTRMTGQDWDQIPPHGAFRAHIKRFPLMPGRYTVNLWCEVNGLLADWVREAAVISVMEGDYFGTGYLAPLGHGGVVVEHEWEYTGSGPSDV